MTRARTLETRKLLIRAQKLENSEHREQVRVPRAWSVRKQHLTTEQWINTSKDKSCGAPPRESISSRFHLVDSRSQSEHKNCKVPKTGGWGWIQPRNRFISFVGAYAPSQCLVEFWSQWLVRADTFVRSLEHHKLWHTCTRIAKLTKSRTTCARRHVCTLEDHKSSRTNDRIAKLTKLRMTCARRHVCTFEAENY